MTPPIVVGVDPLRHDPEAAVLAALLARATGAPVVAVAVYPTRSPSASAAVAPSRRSPRHRPRPPVRRSSPRSTASRSRRSPLPDRPRRASCTTARRTGAPACRRRHPPRSPADLARSTADRLLHGRRAIAVAARLRRAHARLERIGAAFVDSEEGHEALRATLASARRRAARRDRGRARGLERHEPRAALRRPGPPSTTSAHRRRSACAASAAWCRRADPLEVLVNGPLTALEQLATTSTCSSAARAATARSAACCSAASRR